MNVHIPGAHTQSRYPTGTARYGIRILWRFEVFLVNEKILSSILVLTVANWEHSVGDGAIGVLLTLTHMLEA